MRRPLLLLTMALSLSAGCARARRRLRAVTFQRISRVSSDAGRHSWAGGGHCRSHRRELGGGVRPAGRRAQHRHPARHALSPGWHDTDDRGVAGAPVRVGRTDLARRYGPQIRSVEPRRGRDNPAVVDAYDRRRQRSRPSPIGPNGSRRLRRRSPAAPTRRFDRACPPVSSRC